MPLTPNEHVQYKFWLKLYDLFCLVILFCWYTYMVFTVGRYFEIYEVDKAKALHQHVTLDGCAK